MTRAELLELLEVERYTPRAEPGAYCLPPVTPEEAAEHRAVLLDALSDDPVVVAFRERQAGAA